MVIYQSHDLIIILRQSSQTETSLKIFKFGSNAPQNGWRLGLRPRPRIRIRGWGKNRARRRPFRKGGRNCATYEGTALRQWGGHFAAGIKDWPGSTFIWPWNDLTIVLRWRRHCSLSVWRQRCRGDVDRHGCFMTDEPKPSHETQQFNDIQWQLCTNLIALNESHHCRHIRHHFNVWQIAKVLENGVWNTPWSRFAVICWSFTNGRLVQSHSELQQTTSKFIAYTKWYTVQNLNSLTANDDYQQLTFQGI